MSNNVNVRTEDLTEKQKEQTASKYNQESRWSICSIKTDHQPPTFALSAKNNNEKLKRWKSYLEKYNHEHTSQVPPMK